MLLISNPQINPTLAHFCYRLPPIVTQNTASFPSCAAGITRILDSLLCGSQVAEAQEALARASKARSLARAARRQADALRRKMRDQLVHHKQPHKVGVNY